MFSGLFSVTKGPIICGLIPGDMFVPPALHVINMLHVLSFGTRRIGTHHIGAVPVVSAAPQHGQGRWIVLQQHWLELRYIRARRAREGVNLGSKGEEGNSGCGADSVFHHQIFGPHIGLAT